MSILHIAGYKFISLSDIDVLREWFLTHSITLNLKGTILLSQEGINISVAGKTHDINSLKQHLKEDQRFADIPFCQSCCDMQPFKRLKVKLKKEIISFRKPNINVCKS